MKNICPICDEKKKLNWLGYIHQDICKNCKTSFDLKTAIETLKILINDIKELQLLYVKDYIYDAGYVLENLIQSKRINSHQYLFVSNFLVKEKILYECYLSDHQFTYESEIIELKPNDIIAKLNSYVQSCS